MPGPNIINYDKRLWKKCIKCRTWRPREDLELEDGTTKKHGFGEHDTSSDGLQSICFGCKGKMNKLAREKNPVARVRHHTATRCLTQLGDLAPDKFTENLEGHLGYKIRALVKALGKDLKDREGPQRKLRDALNEGYHIDHIRPLSSFDVTYRDKNQIECVDWDIFRECWAISNLSAITAEENLEKGAKRAESPRKEETKEDATQEEEVATSAPERTP